VAKPEIDRERKVIVVPATIKLKAFRGGEPPHHHLLTWKGGRAGKKALLVTPASDTAILDALEALGGEPGDNLEAEAWSERDDPHDPRPDVQAKGPLLTVTVVLADGTRHDVGKLLDDPDGKGIEWRLAGNRALIKVWKSGCVCCLQSCPGSKIANARYTMRDHYHERSRFAPSKLAEEIGEGAQLKVEIGFGGR